MLPFEKKGMYFRNETRDGFNSVTKETTSYTRRALYVEMDLPIDQEYSSLIEAIVKKSNNNDT